ncbi:hypothetical protein PR048_001618 [Dryococelus australis]|uniref:Uncharacterized protein n=1 Tax=Dryococelus australis TaxID=614101 RepID=A0ABQ9IJ86_9NEOP|nr:hypothetical protein PR048_001618 [Dryococelus australis]
MALPARNKLAFKNTLAWDDMHAWTVCTSDRLIGAYPNNCFAIMQTCMCLFRLNDTNLRHVYDDHVNTGMTLSDFKAMCALCWKEKYGFLTIVKDCLLHRGRYRRGFDQSIAVCREGSSAGNQQVMSSIPPATSMGTVSTDDKDATVNDKDGMSAVQSVSAEGTLARCSCEVEKLQNKQSSALNTDEHTTLATKKSKLDIEDETGIVDDQDDIACMPWRSFCTREQAPAHQDHRVNKYTGTRDGLPVLLTWAYRFSDWLHGAQGTDLVSGWPLRATRDWRTTFRRAADAYTFITVDNMTLKVVFLWVGQCSVHAHKTNERSTSSSVYARQYLPARLTNGFHRQALLHRSLVGNKHGGPVERASDNHGPEAVAHCRVGVHAGKHNILEQKFASGCDILTVHSYGSVSHAFKAQKQGSDKGDTNKHTVLFSSAKFGGDRGGVVVRLLASHLSEPGSILGGVAAGRAGRCRWSAGFLEDHQPPSPFQSGSVPYSPRFTLICSQDHDTVREEAVVPDDGGSAGGVVAQAEDEQQRANQHGRLERVVNGQRSVSNFKVTWIQDDRRPNGLTEHEPLRAPIPEPLDSQFQGNVRHVRPPTSSRLRSVNYSRRQMSNYDSESYTLRSCTAVDVRAWSVRTHLSRASVTLVAARCLWTSPAARTCYDMCVCLARMSVHVHVGCPAFDVRWIDYSPDTTNPRQVGRARGKVLQLALLYQNGKLNSINNGVRVEAPGLTGRDFIVRGRAQ